MENDIEEAVVAEVTDERAEDSSMESTDPLVDGGGDD